MKRCRIVAANRNPAMGSVTVRLFPIVNEHMTALIVDVAFFLVLLVVWSTAIGAVHGASLIVVLGLVALFHFVQVWWLVVDRFDDTGVTIIRPWRRQHVPWTRISGLVYTQGVQSQTRAPYKLRLVLKDNEPPLGRYLTRAELERFATGPVLMSMYDMEQDLHLGDDNRGVQCAQRVYAELERHGFPKPPPHTLDFRTPRYTSEEVNRAAAMDLLKLHPVTVTHGPLDDDGTHLLDTELPDLARDSGPVREIHREPGYAIFSFEDSEGADAFLAAARGVAPAAWSIAAGALPAVEPA
jgi:hypothetical protein